MRHLQKVILLAFTALLTVSVCHNSHAQELNATIELNTQKIEGTNKSVFDNLKTTLTSFINERQWTEYTYQNNEKIRCSFNIIVNKYTESNGMFECECYIQCTRPVFNTAYTSTTLQIHDKKFNFRFQEFDQLNYDDEHITNSLTALVAYYCYLIIATDMDTMSPMGGTEFLQKAMNIVNNAQSLDATGWKAFEDATNRFGIINDWVSESMNPLRQLQYDYHRKGLDMMAEKPDEARKAITTSILTNLKAANGNKPLSKLPLLWTETKRDELVGIYKGQGSQSEKQDIYNLLVKLNAAQSSYWKELQK